MAGRAEKLIPFGAAPLGMVAIETCTRPYEVWNEAGLAFGSRAA